MKITVEGNRFGHYVIVAETGRTRYIQQDLSFPGVARDFGWDIASVQFPADDADDDAAETARTPFRCTHIGTDGSVDCPACGMTAGQFIASAAEYLDNCNEIVDDPGYFGAE